MMFNLDFLVLLFIILLVASIADLVSISLFVKLAREKGYCQGKNGETVSAGLLWFIGIFATPLVLGIYVAALPNKNSPVTASSLAANAAYIKDDLPDV